MYDVIQLMLPLAYKKSRILRQFDLMPQQYSLITIHRPANTDDPVRMEQIVSALNTIEEKIVFPIHPRTRKSLADTKILFNSNVRVIDPVSYFDMIVLEDNARLIATDSGGVQREAYFLRKACLTLRDETEWTATVDSGWNMIVGADLDTICSAWFTFQPPSEYPSIFGDGDAARKIVDLIETI
jgi:UDP-GlcNAc3NAcA epimerase